MTGPASSPQPPSDADVQQRLARALGPKYTVRHLLGRGGFAEVYEVWDQDLDRRLAVKVLRPDIAWTSGMLDRFRHEARAVAKLSHPNILPIHFIDEAEGIVYYAMPFVEGESLGDILRKEGPLETGQALRLARPILDALQHAHETGLIHRDIKPENVMVERATGKPLLVDFGIAKRLDAGKGLTQTGFVVGTPQYMSPEQALGEVNLDGRSDLYSMGAVLFQMVTGAPPFVADTSQEVVAKHITEPPPEPSQVNTKIPRWLSDVIVRALAKKPAERFQSAATMLDVLAAGAETGSPDLVTAARVADRVASSETVKIQSGQRPVSRARGATPATPATPAPSPAAAAPKRRPVLAILGGAAVVGGAIGGGYLAFSRSALEFENRLVEQVRLSADGQQRVVEPGETLRVKLARGGGQAAQWALERPASVAGPMGVEMAGTIALTSRRGTIRAAASARGDTSAYFAPLITNATDQPLRVIVNFGLRGARPCGCVVPPGATRLHVGYYPLFGNSTVRVEDPAGRWAMFTDLGGQIEPDPGTVGLRFETRDLRAPPVDRTGPAQVDRRSLPAARRLLRARPRP
ncbi:MAG: serine/threonine protein kinase [Gemmatimonadetes bacterium]|nr:serine/threonine protein kinase [Gemmatimonadota bacterium]